MLAMGHALAAAARLGYLARIAALGVALLVVARLPRGGARSGGLLT